MQTQESQLTARYQLVTEEKSGGATYTPKELADFVAHQIVNAINLDQCHDTLRILDPAVGEGELLSSLLSQLPRKLDIEVFGFDTNCAAIKHTTERLHSEFPKLSLSLEVGNFLDFVLQKYDTPAFGGLFQNTKSIKYDLIIANPPYVRTQIIGADHSRLLAKQFGLTGRVDLYHAFILAMSMVLKTHGVAGIIVSNRFMTTKTGATVRRALKEHLELKHVWDLGDTKLFDAAVLPAVLLAEGLNGARIEKVHFTSIYETKSKPSYKKGSVIDALDTNGTVLIGDGRKFNVRQGTLNDSGDLSDVWRIATEEGDAWLATVASRTWKLFGEIGKVRVGVKTCADKVFIRKDWSGYEDLELLRPLITHHIACRFRADMSKGQRKIIYPHEMRCGKRQAVSLDLNPRSTEYLEEHRHTLEARKYVLEAGREWYEIWVPQDPGAWHRVKLVFRDISEFPCFWIDQDGAVVNGDCYWMTCDRIEDEQLLWLAAGIGNSTFIESFYDHRFNNKLYAGRRRFITQYVENFPLPDPESCIAKDIIKLAKTAYETLDLSERKDIGTKIDRLVWRAFDLQVEEIAR